MTVRALSSVIAPLVVGTVFAQQVESASDTQLEEGGAKAERQVPAEKPFTALPFCQQADGIAEVRVQASGEWVAAEPGKFYPLGTSYRTRGEASRLIVKFGADSSAEIGGDASFGTRVQPLGIASRTIVIGHGLLKVSLARNLHEGMFFVASPGFTIKNLAGESTISYTALPDGNDVVVRCVTGTLGIEGRHFDIPQMRVADEIRIRSTVDNLLTFLYGNSGDYIVKLDRGIVSQRDIDAEGNEKIVTTKATLDWHLSPKTKVRIDRMIPAIGDKMSVAMMTFDAAGELKNNFAYAEGRAEVNTGELAAAAQEEEKKAVKKATETSSEADDASKEEEKKEDSQTDNNKTEE